MLQFIRRFCLERYFSTRLIFGIDLLVSAVASIVAVLMLTAFRGSRLLLDSALWWIGISLLATWLAFYFFKTYRAVIRHSTLRDIGRLTLATMSKAVLMGIVLGVLPTFWLPARWMVASLVLDFLLTLSMLVLVRVVMLLAYDIMRARFNMRRAEKNVFVYGSDQKAVALAMRFRNSEHYNVLGFLDHGERRESVRLSEWRVYFFNSQRDFLQLRERFGLSAVIFPTADAARGEQERLLSYLGEQHVKALIAPPLDEVDGERIDGHHGTMSAAAGGVREVKIEDLLERKEIRVKMDEIVENFRGKTILVTGAAGSIGSELCRQLAGFSPQHLVLFDNAETPMHNLRLEFDDRYPGLSFSPVIGDVRQEARLDYVFRKFHPQIVFHAAAYKHVPLMEENPCEAVLVNVVGSRNVALKCIEYDVEKMVMISTDKAVNPTNIMGCTKRLAEIYVQSLGLSIAHGQTGGRTKFVTTRFGNVLGSNGSVIPRFREQISRGGPVTVTHPEITRYFMTIPEACRLVMEAATMTSGNEIFVFDMGQPVKIAHLARRMIELAGYEVDKDIRIEYTGLRPGEKLYEEVLSNAENTTPTENERIRVARVREYDYAEAHQVVEQLERLSREVRIPDMVILMKKTVPEFKSNNSVYEKFDNAAQSTENS